MKKILRGSVICLQGDVDLLLFLFSMVCLLLLGHGRECNVPCTIIYTILWLFLCRVLCNWMLDHDESFLVSSVVFGADMWTTIGHLSYIHDAYISLHITHS